MSVPFFSTIYLVLLCCLAIILLFKGSITLAAWNSGAPDRDRIFEALLESGQITFRERCVLFLCGKFSWALKTVSTPKPEVSADIFEHVQSSLSNLQRSAESLEKRVQAINREQGQQPHAL